MASANASASYPRILIGPTGSDREIHLLARSLQADGCEVQTFTSMPVEVALTEFDMAVLVVTESDPLNQPAADHRIQRILHAAGFLEARLAPGRVCLLVEESVDQLDAPPIPVIRYRSGDPMEAKPELTNFVSSQYPDVVRDLHQPETIKEQVRSGDLRLGWVLLLAVLLATVVPLVFLVRQVSDDEGAEVATVDDVGPWLASGQPAGPDVDARSSLGSATASSDGNGTEAGDGSGPGAAQEGTATDGSSGVGSETDGSATDGSTAETDDSTAATDSGRTALLPATCTINVRKSLALPEAVSCDPVGFLIIEGWEGPWHNGIGGIAIAEGVTGTVYHEPRPDGSTAGPREVELTNGTTYLNPADAQYGTNDIEFVFSAVGQHAHVFRSEDADDLQTTLTFTLDQP